MNDFAHDENVVIPGLKQEKTKLLAEIQSKENSDCSNNLLPAVLDLQDRIKDIDTKIRQLKKKKKDYYLNNSHYIFDYFLTKKKISETNSSSTHPSSSSSNHPSTSTSSTSQPLTNEKNRMIQSFFKIKAATNNKDLPNNTSATTLVHHPAVDETKLQTSLASHNIVQKYLANIDDMFLDVQTFSFSTDRCEICQKGEMIPIEDEGILICNACSRSIPYLTENEKPSYKEPPKEVCFYAYKRINHFKEILAQFQGKETTQIPPDIIESIKQQIRKERIDITKITNAKTKEILKKLGYNKYYEHIPFIKEKLGIKPPIMSPELEETLCNLFIELQAPYSKYCPDDRVNFLNYYYTAYKLCELLGETQYLEYFPMLKDKEKRIEQDTIWKKICEELDWEFIHTI